MDMCTRGTGSSVGTEKQSTCGRGNDMQPSAMGDHPGVAVFVDRPAGFGCKRRESQVSLNALVMLQTADDAVTPPSIFTQGDITWAPDWEREPGGGGGGHSQNDLDSQSKNGNGTMARLRTAA